MKTYAETMGHKPFNWNRFLARRIAGLRTPESDEKAGRVAGDWVTCACGNLCAVIPRYEPNGSPKDQQLFFLGNQFMADINGAKWAEAQRTLALIEARSKAILRSLAK